jgi:peroxiredoxin
MNRRQHQYRAAWVFGLAVCALVSGGVPEASAQIQQRLSRFQTLSNEYALLLNNPTMPMEQRQKAEEKLAASLLQFVEEAPKEVQSFQALTYYFNLKHATPDPRAVRFVVEHHRKTPGLLDLMASQWASPTVSRHNLLRRLTDFQDLPMQERGTLLLILARDTFVQANETGDRELARHAERYADQFQKAYPDPSTTPIGTVAPVYVTRLMDGIRKSGVGKTAPKTETQDVLNNPFKLDDLRGKVVLFYFYTGASTMYPKVRAQLDPHLARLKGRPVVFVMVASTSASLLANKVKMDPGGPTVLSGGSAKKAAVGTGLFQDWGVYAYPTAVLVDAQGTIRFRFSPPGNTPFGQEPAFLQRLDAALDQLVGEAVQR